MTSSELLIKVRASYPDGPAIELAERYELLLKQAMRMEQAIHDLCKEEL